MDTKHTHLPLIFVCVDLDRNLSNVVKMGSMVCGDHPYINLQGEVVRF